MMRRERSRSRDDRDRQEERDDDREEESQAPTEPAGSSTPTTTRAEPVGMTSEERTRRNEEMADLNSMANVAAMERDTASPMFPEGRSPSATGEGSLGIPEGATSSNPDEIERSLRQEVQRGRMRPGIARLVRSVVGRFRELHGSGPPTGEGPEEEDYTPSIAPDQGPPEESEDVEYFTQYTDFMEYVDEETKRDRLPTGLAVLIRKVVLRFERYNRSQAAQAEGRSSGSRDRELEELQRRCDELAEALNSGNLDVGQVRERYDDVYRANRGVVQDVLREIGIQPVGSEEVAGPVEQEEAVETEEPDYMQGIIEDEWQDMHESLQELTGRGVLTQDQAERLYHTAVIGALRWKSSECGFTGR